MKYMLNSRKVKRLMTAIVGGFILIIGIIAIPYPGPGWLIVFAGLGILSTEFEWARRWLDYARKKYDAWQDWIKRQPMHIKAVFWLVTFTVVILTIWLLNGYGLLNQWFNLGQDWLVSPIFR